MRKPIAAMSLGCLMSVALLSADTLAVDIVIGTGSSSRIHYSVARVLCRQLERTVKDTNCEVFPVSGRDAAEPLAVMSHVRDGAIEIGIVPSDWQYHAVHGSGPIEFMDVRFDNLRSLFSLQS